MRPEDDEAVAEIRPSTKITPQTIRVRDHIEHLILSGKVAGGERINENALAAELDISRGPIREVTRQLAEVGLLEIIRNRGAFVRKVSLQDVLNIYDVRSGLARVAGRLAAVRATETHIKELRALWHKMSALQSEQAFTDYYEINREFHARIFAISNNAKLCEIDASTEREASLFLRRGVFSPAHVGISNKEHGEILKAIVARDENAAAAAFEQHIISGKLRMLDASNKV